MADKHGIVCTIPLQCDCGYIGNVACMRWCVCCGHAICPDCFPKGKQHDDKLDRCQKCLDAKLPSALELAGRKHAEEWHRKREQVVIDAILN